MASMKDWAARAAQRIARESRDNARLYATMRPERLAAIIVIEAEPILKLLQESRRQHDHCDDSWYCCGKCNSIDHGLDEGEYVSGHDGRESGVCTCGADAWNARVDEVLN